jgi:hypothetical protein
MTFNPPEGIPSAPAPWTCKARAWWIPTSSGGKPPAEDTYHPLEEDHYAKIDIRANYRGPGMIQVVRYSETPVGMISCMSVVNNNQPACSQTVGPYDELLITPGAFTNPKGPGKYNRITRIYVNQKATCWNGNEELREAGLTCLY